MIEQTTQPTTRDHGGAPRRFYTHKQRSHALALYRAGRSLKQVERATGVHYSAVNRWARQEKIVRGYSHAMTLYMASDPTRIEIADRVRRGFEQGLTLRTIAQRLGIPYTTVYHVARRQGLRRSPDEGRRMHKATRLKINGSVYWDAVNETMQLLAIDGLGATAIAARLGVTRNTVYNRRRTAYGRALARFAFGPGSISSLDRKTAAIEMTAEGVPIERIVKCLDVSTDRVERWIATTPTTGEKQ
jgi:transposase